MNDGEFERMLLQSARGDAPPDDARDAWARFSGTLGAMGSRPRTGDNSAGGNPTVAANPILTGTARTAAMKWLLCGAIGGSAVSAAVMIRVPGRQTTAPAIVVVQRPTAPTNVAGLPGTQSGPVAPDVGPTPIVTAPLPAPRSVLAPHPKHNGRGHARARQDATDPMGSDSTLAAEVSRIDAARTANAAGDYDEAVWLVGRYHRDFPGGALAPDADVVALEAIAAKRDGPETARRAALFLSHYPDDPHAAKVKWLAEHLGSDQR
jgi:hypothetical protein